jgi:hypothetical protein
MQLSKSLPEKMGERWEVRLPKPRRPKRHQTRDPNAQGRKLSFLETRADRGIYNPHGLELPVSPYQVMAAVRQMGSQRPEFSCLQVEPGEFGLCFLHAVMGFP